MFGKILLIALMLFSLTACPKGGGQQQGQQDNLQNEDQNQNQASNQPQAADPRIEPPPPNEPQSAHSTPEPSSEPAAPADAFDRFSMLMAAVGGGALGTAAARLATPPRGTTVPNGNSRPNANAPTASLGGSRGIGLPMDPPRPTSLPEPRVTFEGHAGR